jgi:hypothetical protein
MYCEDPNNVNNMFTISQDHGMYGPFPRDGSAFTEFLAWMNSPPGFAGHTDWRMPSSGGDPGSDPVALCGMYPCYLLDAPELESIYIRRPPSLDPTSPTGIDSVFGATWGGFYSTISLARYDGVLPVNWDQWSEAWAWDFSNTIHGYSYGGGHIELKTYYYYVRAVRDLP